MLLLCSPNCLLFSSNSALIGAKCVLRKFLGMDWIFDPFQC